MAGGGGAPPVVPPQAPTQAAPTSPPEAAAEAEADAEADAEAEEAPVSAKPRKSKTKHSAVWNAKHAASTKKLKAEAKPAAHGKAKPKAAHGKGGEKKSRPK
jgi:hypothetical protein